MTLEQLNNETLRKKNKIILIMLILSVILGTVVEMSLNKPLLLIWTIAIGGGILCLYYCLLTYNEPPNKINFLYVYNRFSHSVRCHYFN